MPAVRIWKKSPYKLKQVKEWQLVYQQLVEKIGQKFHLSLPALYNEMASSAQKYNKYARITGDSVVYVAKEFIRYKNKINFNHYTTLMEQFIKDQMIEKPPALKMTKKLSRHEKFLDKLSRIIIDFREGL